MARRRQSDSFLNPTLSRGIIVVVLALAAIIIALSFIDRAGVVGIMLNEYVLSALFGSMRYAVPPTILLITWFMVLGKEYRYHPTHTLGGLLFFISVCSLFHLQFVPTDMWPAALAGQGGGIFGMAAWLLQTYFGTIAAWIVLIGLAVVGTLLVFQPFIGSFLDMYRAVLSIFVAIGQAFARGIRRIFVPSEAKNSAHVRVQGDYARDDEEEEEVDEEETETEEDSDEEEVDEEETEEAPAAPQFQKKALVVRNGDEEEEDEETEAETSSGDVWSKKVVIKNLPPMDLLSDKRGKPTSGDIEGNATIIKNTLEQFNIEVDMGEVRVGPTVTQYTLKPAAGVKLSRITDLNNNLSFALAAHPIRIEAPIPGKSLVGVEVPNQKTALVSFKELMEDKGFGQRAHNMMLLLGKDVAGKVWFGDLPRLPHLLVAGATGSGKTVCMNTIIMGLLYQNTAETLRMIMVDPKRVELTLYNGIPHLLTPVITNVQKTVNALKWTIGEMERRFELLASVGSRDIGSYNQKHPEAKIPYIVFVIDELADLMAAAANEIESGIIRVAQMARAVGIHLIVATQRPSVDVITGLMKANIPGRIAFSVASAIDSRTILDAPGAEKLMGRGDMLYSCAELSRPVRIQGAFISEEEMKRVVDYLKGDEEPEYDESIVGTPANSGTNSMFGGPTDEQDALFEDAKRFVIQAGKASASLLQRRMKVGYARAARLLDELEQAGIVGPADGAKPREVFVTSDDESDSMNSGQELNVFSAPKDDVTDTEEEEETESDHEDNPSGKALPF